MLIASKPKVMVLLLVPVAGIAGGAWWAASDRSRNTPGTAPAQLMEMVRGTDALQGPAIDPSTRQIAKNALAAGASPGPADSPAAAAALPAGRQAGRGLPASGSQLPPQGGRVVVDEAAKFVHFRVGSRNVKRVFRDRHIIWVATSDGIVRYDTDSKEYRYFDHRSGLRSPAVLHVGKLDGHVVAGMHGGGLARFNEQTGRWDAIGMNASNTREATVHHVLQARTGEAWIATASGVLRIPRGAILDPARWERHSAESTKGGLPSDWVYAIAEGPRGDLWMATAAGVARLAEGHWRNWNHAQGLGAPYEVIRRAGGPPPSAAAGTAAHHVKQKEEMGLAGTDPNFNPNYVLAIAVDRQGTVWAGTWGGGLSRFDGSTWHNLATSDGLPGNHVYSLHHDDSGTLWVATDHGVARRDKTGFRVLTVRDGLFADNVFTITTGRARDLWAGSLGGVANLSLTN